MLTKDGFWSLSKRASCAVVALALLSAPMSQGAVRNTRPVFPLGDNDLQNILANNVLDAPPGIHVSGPVYSAIADQSNQAVFTGTGSGGSVATFIIEISASASTNRFGLYDFADPSKMVEIFDGNSGPGSQTIVSFLMDGTVQVFFQDAGVVGFSGNFGFYVDVYSAPPAGGGDGSSMTYDYTVFTEDSLNPGGAPQALLYQGNGLTTIMLPFFAPGIFGTKNWIIAFEDRLVGGPLAGTSDEDYSDLVIMVESILPVPPEECCDIPTLSRWGLAIMVLLLLTGAKLQFGRPEAVAVSL